MGAGALMTQRCRVERDVATGADPYGGPAAPDWRTHITELPCRLWTAKGETRITTERLTVLDELRAMVPLSAEVTERDRIADVRERSGDEVNPGPLRIDAIARRRDHLELSLAQAGG